ncbi:hypothetical protein TWF788_008619 [Orbilia oligospora]|uniref:F-box domain-containing protein n=1 Tax=Orbilia oligospora TaxID=2813651 RepID=A0A7C8KJN9_ORBOL|nr:hypothetical protein TWF788_008619 [Orbilia oligospora]
MPAARRTRSSAHTSNLAPTKRARKSATSSSSTSTKAFTTPRQAKYPPWATLPYHVLVPILKFAATNLQNTSVPIDHAWLANAARTCKAFADPANDLLYHTPPMTPISRLRKFFDALKANPLLSRKVRRIESHSAEICDTKLLKFGLQDIVQLSTHVTGVCVSSGPWSPELLYASGRKPDMDPSVLTALQSNGTKLQDWTWDGELCWAIAAQYDTRDESPKKKTRTQRGFGWLHTVHKDVEPFKSLKALTITGFDTPMPLEYYRDDEEEAEVEAQIATIASSLGHLKYLKDLTLKDCTFVNAYFLSQLAGVHELKRLVLEDLKNINTVDLQSFLQMSGRHLEELEIIHCPGIYAGFLSILDTATPSLKRLLYEDVPGVLSHEELELLEIPMPRWPQTLESLIMRGLGNWTAADCERVLEGMADTARNGGFMALREIDIWCILPELSWRDRAASRRRWGDEFAMAFLDRRGNAWNEFVAKKKSEGHKVKWYPNVTVGLCERVLFRLDDSRPTGNQLREADFLDLSESRPTKRSPKKAAAVPKRASPKKKGKQAAALKEASPSKPNPKKRRGTQNSQSFVVGSKRPRYNSDEDSDFKVDKLAYEDEDGNDSSWSVDDMENQ